MTGHASRSYTARQPHSWAGAIMDASKYVSRVEGHAVVLGGSGGLGAEIARALAASGATAVSVTYGRNKDAAAKVAAEIAGHGVKAFAAHIDQSDEASFNSFLDAAVAATGSEISVAVNSIGIS